MKEMIKRVREEKGGFTLAELLIVVAIVLVLVAIAVPVFTGALNDAQKSVRGANERSVKAQANSTYLLTEYKAKGTGEAAVEGAWIVDKKGNLYKPGDTAAPEAGEQEGVYTVAVDPGTADPNGIIEPKITVTRADPVKS